MRCKRKFLMIVLGLGFVANLSAAPQIDGVSGTFEQGGSLTIRGNSFSQKAEAKPLFFWEADGGKNPTALGRKTLWDNNNGFNGDVVDASDPNAEVAPGSTQVAQYHIAKEDGSMLGKVSFDTGETYIWRKRRDGFDIATDYPVQMRFIDLVALVPGSTLSDGMLMSSEDKVVWGKIQFIEWSNTGVEGAAFYSNKVGNIGELDSKNYMTHYPEQTIYFYAENDVDLTTPLMSAERNSGYGYSVTLNHKTIRIWADYGALSQSAIISPCFDGSPLFHSGGINFSNINSIIRCDEWDTELMQQPHKWVIEEFEYKGGSIDTEDSVMNYSMNNALALDKKFELRTSSKPELLKDIYQFQAPHGAQLGSYEYYDSLYVDDSRHRVIICDSPTYSACENPEVQIPNAWSETQITISARLKAFRNVADEDKVSFKDLYLYVADKDGTINESGMNLCLQCIKAPELSAKK